MNIFKTMESFIQSPDGPALKATTTDIFSLADSIRSRLGDQGYLMDKYLSLVLESACESLAYESGIAGLDAAGELRQLLHQIQTGSASAQENPFCEQAQKLVAEHPLAYQEESTRTNLYFSMLADAYLPQRLEEFLSEVKGELNYHLDVIYLQDLFCKICVTAGEEDMEQLNLMLKQRIFRALPADGFIQNYTNDLLYTLSYRDSETNMQIFQLLRKESETPETFFG